MTVILGGSNYNPPPIGEEVGYIAPGNPALAPIALPAGIVPPGTVELSPPGGELPPGLPPISNLSESFASNLAVGFLRTHTSATGDVSGTDLSPSYSTAIEVHDAADFFHYAVTETAAQITAHYVVHDGPHSELLSSAEQTGSLHGGLVYAQFDNNLLTAMAVHSEIAGVDTLWTYPEASASGTEVSPGLGLPDGYARARRAGSSAPERPGRGNRARYVPRGRRPVFHTHRRGTGTIQPAAGRLAGATRDAPQPARSQSAAGR